LQKFKTWLGRSVRDVSKFYYLNSGNLNEGSGDLSIIWLLRVRAGVHRPIQGGLIFDHMLRGTDSRGIEVFSLDNSISELELPNYYAVQWKIALKLDEIKIEGSTIN